MTEVRVTKKFTFEMAHALWNYDGVCSNIHGHSYILYVTVIGTPITDKNHVKLGMVIDFGDLKKIVKSEIIDPFDHAVALNKDFPDLENFNVPEMFDRHHYLDYQPTCENMVIDFAQRINSKLTSSIQLFSVKLYETATSFAEWFAEDNKSFK